MQDFRMETFLTVCQHMTFTKAAEVLHITQPAVSQHIRFIEQYYQVKLFLLQGKQLVLTRAGELLLQAAMTTRHDDIYLKEQLRTLPNQNSDLIFGATLTIGEFVLPDCLITYQKKYPHVTLHMQVDNTQALLEKLSKGEIEFALVEGYFDRGQYDARVYAMEDYIAVCGMDAHIPKKIFHIEELWQERIFVREKGSGSREIMERYLEERNYSLQNFEQVSELGSIHIIKRMVEQNLGITFLYRSAVISELKQGKLREITPQDGRIRHEFTFLWPKGSMFSERYQKIFLDFQEKESDKK